MKLTITNTVRSLSFKAFAGVLCCLLLSYARAAAQTRPEAPAQSQYQANGKPCTAPPPAQEPSAAERFPFPGEAPGLPVHPPDVAKPPEKAQGTPVGSASKPQTQTDTRTAFPFPGEPEDAAGNSSSSSSSSSDSGTYPDADTDNEASQPKDSDRAPLTRTQRRHLPKVEDLDRREAEDIEVSRYYLSTGDFRAAYLRAKDAVKTIPDDPDAHFALAESAERLKKMDEAVAEYKAYLAMDPDGTKAKAAHKALGDTK